MFYAEIHYAEFIDQEVFNYLDLHRFNNKKERDSFVLEDSSYRNSITSKEARLKHKGQFSWWKHNE